MESPVVADLADLDALKIIVVVDKGVHVAMKPLQIVDCRCVELNLDEVLWICTNDEVDIVPVRK